MKKIDHGGPAYPCEQGETQDGTWNQTFEPGMTLRQWYAGKALAFLGDSNSTGEVAEVAFYAFKVADAMIAHERREREEQEKANATPDA